MKDGSLGNPNELVLLAEIPGYSEAGAVEVTKDIWPIVNEIVKSVTIAVESGMFLFCPQGQGSTIDPVLLLRDPSLGRPHLPRFT